MRTRLLGAAWQLRAYLPPEVTPWLAPVPVELWAPALPSLAAEP
jgi:hypothetical protein